VPGVVMGLAFVVTFNVPPLQITGTAAIIILMLFIRRLPYAVRSSAAILKQIKGGIEEAAISLGARPGRAFLKVTLPLMLFVSLAIKFEGPGPVFDRHSCIGRRSRRFQMLSFRTIAHDPEGTLPRWARKPTQIGQFLRSTRIETLPRLINVLRGEMSITDPDGSSPSFLD